MKNHFNFSRFARLFGKHTAEHIKWYLMATAVLIGAMSLMLGFVAYMQSYPIDLEEQSLIFIFGILGAGSIFTSIVFAHLGDKKQAIAALTLPASHFEKYLVGWIYSFLIFILVFTASFYLVVITIISLDNQGPEPTKLLNIFSPTNRIYLVFLLYAMVHAIAIWGSIYFQRLHLIKTAFAFFIVFLLVIFFNLQWLEVLFNKDLAVAVPFGSIGFHDKKQYYLVELPEAQHSLTFLLPLVLAIILWITAFFGLKEKQV
ncbi:hypothetical protein AHMF7605_02800 [Adhaeribacter arboris]|uniref:Uncharacterized protein n=1 Tax=Adhaeribacter arboris TaxID=2072846 RepID=A0A2T2YAR2_9BACT|nr:hypothetical protein [Adhaeribacter arboris]PSR52528.1 hypothetical protein AHMF7605_02800 [Adhaeribacter arboris]